MDSDLIAAWKAAYTQLAELMVSMEQAKYQGLTAQNGGWTGWRDFKITTIEKTEHHTLYTVTPIDAQAILAADVNALMSVRIQVPQQELRQPQQFKLTAIDASTYQFAVEAVADASEFSVANILIQHYQVGDQVEISAPLSAIDTATTA